MAQLRQEYSAFEERDTVIAAVGPENSSDFRDYWESNDMPFIGLPDEKNKVLKLFGQEVDLFKMGRMPAQIIIDKKGIVRYVHYGHSMKDIPENRELLDLLDKLQEEG